VSVTGGTRNHAWGRAGAACGRKITDNSGVLRSADRAGQQPFPSVHSGHLLTRIVSRTEEAAWIRFTLIRVAAVEHAHQRSPTVAKRSDEPQLNCMTGNRPRRAIGLAEPAARCDSMRDPFDRHAQVLAATVRSSRWGQDG
jgi:hypothetical protein